MLREFLHKQLRGELLYFLVIFIVRMKNASERFFWSMNVSFLHYGEMPYEVSWSGPPLDEAERVRHTKLVEPALQPFRSLKDKWRILSQ